MLLFVQLMKIFLRTGWGESTDFIQGGLFNNLNGLSQGKGAAHVSCLVLSVVLIHIYKRLSYGSKSHSLMERI